MTFENLSCRFTYEIPDYPKEWFSLLHLYDADTPLFPLQYFHILPDGFPSDETPKAKDRAFGFIERTRPTDSRLEVSVICNKDLSDSQNSSFLSPLRSEIEERLGASNPVIIKDVSTAFSQQKQANLFLADLWRKIVSKTFGGSLPFGRFYDPVFGLARMMASFYSPGGRKSEWIQTHYFSSKFGEKIPVDPNLTQVDFYLLPTFRELVAGNLKLFPDFKSLSDAAEELHNTFCSVKNIGGGLNFSKFNSPYSGSLSTEKLMRCINTLNATSIEPLIQCFNAFDKGPFRTVMFLQTLNDLRAQRLTPQNLTSAHFGLMYTKLSGFYQTPKVLSLYAQQCFGNTSALPIDTWVETFLKWPLKVYPKSKGNLPRVFAMSNNLGKVERLIWISAQARKIHSSICDDALWCIKYASKGKPRGANPLACNACSLRRQCPAYAAIANETVIFNATRRTNRFEIRTSGGNNTAPNQNFVLCKGEDKKYGEIHDDFTPVDAPNAFAPFPQPDHQGGPLTVKEFVNKY